MPADGRNDAARAAEIMPAVWRLAELHRDALEEIAGYVAAAGLDEATQQLVAWVVWDVARRGKLSEPLGIDDRFEQIARELEKEPAFFPGAERTALNDRFFDDVVALAAEISQADSDEHARQAVRDRMTPLPFEYGWDLTRYALSYYAQWLFHVGKPEDFDQHARRIGQSAFVARVVLFKQREKRGF